MLPCTLMSPDAVGEMVLLARENGARRLFIPAGRSDDVSGLPAGLREDMLFEYFSTPVELIAAVFAPRRANCGQPGTAVHPGDIGKEE